MKQFIYFTLLSIFVFTGCTYKELEAIRYEKSVAPVDYEREIKPILDKRCVVCHSCYNSPCQFKLSSYEGLSRGASKIDMYANRLEATDPTRLFIDAKTDKQWRKKGFFSVTEEITPNTNDSIMMQFLNQKMLHPKSTGEYAPDKDELMCAKNKDELQKYFDDNPHKGMPYGMPALNKKEYNKIANWLEQGGLHKKQQKETLPKEYKTITQWEEFFNQTPIKNRVTSRYIYEHLYLAHIQFDTIPNKFFKLVRSKTPSPLKIDIMATRLVYNAPTQEKFYYRFQEITSTLVHKTHMVYHLNKRKMNRFKELFLEKQWIEKPYLVSYKTVIASNALQAFEQIPPQSRYQFLLDDNHFFIMTFIRGPVCRGQVALNVINDHFWVMFLDPKYDMAVKDRFFLHDNLNNLAIPNEKGDNPGIFETFAISDYAEETIAYYQNRNNLYKKYYEKGLPLDAIWKGNQKEKNDSLLTIYRHFNSASVHKGAYGDIPKTLWVIDYPLFERIYYSLVAGYDVFGNTPQSLLVRKYMDRLRIEGESNFLEFLPKKSRNEIFASWYIGWLANKLTTYTPSDTPSSLNFDTNNVKNEFVQKVFEHTKMPKDKINYTLQETFVLPKEYQTKEDIEIAFQYLSKNNQIIKKITSYSANLSYIRINLKDKSYVYSMVINRWHDNVALLFDEKNRLNPQKDTLDFIEGFIGSYPNYFFEVNQDDFPDFVDLMENYDATPLDNYRLLKYGINRSQTDFWEKYDWFQERFNQTNKVTAGLFDLNRYFEETQE